MIKILNVLFFCFYFARVFSQNEITLHIQDSICIKSKKTKVVISALFKNESNKDFLLYIPVFSIQTNISPKDKCTKSLDLLKLFIYNEGYSLYSTGYDKYDQKLLSLSSFIKKETVELSRKPKLLKARSSIKLKIKLLLMADFVNGKYPLKIVYSQSINHYTFYSSINNPDYNINYLFQGCIESNEALLLVK